MHCQADVDKAFKGGGHNITNLTGLQPGTLEFASRYVSFSTPPPLKPAQLYMQPALVDPSKGDKTPVAWRWIFTSVYAWLID
jgi:hypothetical protein